MYGCIGTFCVDASRITGVGHCIVYFHSGLSTTFYSINGIYLHTFFCKHNPRRGDITGKEKIAMKNYFVVFGLLALLTTCGCGKLEGTLITQTFDVDASYTALSVGDAFDVRFDDSVDRVTVIVGDELMPYVEVKVVNETLKIRVKRNRLRSGNGRKVLLPHNANLSEIELSGASKFWGDVKAESVSLNLSGASKFLGNISAESVKFDLSGASTYEGRIETTDFDINLNGASRADVAGHTTSLSFDLSGASCIKSSIYEKQYTMLCDSCEGELSGASSIYIHCNDMLRVKTSGASKVYYTGNARVNSSGESLVSKDDF